MGRRYLLRVKHTAGPSKVIIRNKTHIELNVRENTSREQREKVMQNWYRKQLKEQIPPLIEKWKRITGIEVNTWGVKIMKTKWGSCNAPAGRIWLNLELAKKPTHSLEYIILHEMVHMKERKHNERFTKIMDRHMPQWKQYKTELNRIILGHTGFLSL